MTLGLVFDLDDTLVYELDYVDSGYRSVSKEIAKVCAVHEYHALASLRNTFKNGERSRSFDCLKQQFPEIPLSVEELVSLYRNHVPDISLAPGAEEMLISLRSQGHHLGVISDGNLNTQSLKGEAVRISEYVDHVIYTDVKGPTFWKPNPWSYQQMSELLMIDPKSMAYFGDNLSKDFLAPNTLGWKTVLYRCPGQVHADRVGPSEDYLPQFAVENYSQIVELVANWSKD